MTNNPEKWLPSAPTPAFIKDLEVFGSSSELLAERAHPGPRLYRVSLRDDSTIIPDVGIIRTPMLGAGCRSWVVFFGLAAPVNFPDGPRPCATLSEVRQRATNGQIGATECAFLSILERIDGPASLPRWIDVEPTRTALALVEQGS